MRYPALDLLRLVAIGMTVLVHTPSLVARIAVLRPFGNALWLGVDLFMLISGWLLGGQLLRDAKAKDFRPGRFYLKRWLRTLPPYYAMLAVLYLLRGADHAQIPPWQMLTHLLFLQNYVGPNLYEVSWSLCVEEHFYLALPLVVLALERRPKLSTPVLLVVALEVLALLARWQYFTANPAREVPLMTHMRCDGLFIGLLLAWVHLHRPDLWAKLGGAANAFLPVGAAATLAVMATVAPPPTAWGYVGAATAGTWGLALVFLAAVHERSWASRINFRGLRYMGELTYAIYLVHSVIPVAWLGGQRGATGIVAVGIRLGVVLGLSMLLHHVIERPALGLRARVIAKLDAKPAAKQS